MKQTRIVLNPKYTSTAREILEITGIENLSALFTTLLTRYGQHLKATWELRDNERSCGCHNQPLTPVSPSENTFKPLSEEPLTSMAELL
jgi:hypothetical protein